MNRILDKYPMKRVFQVAVNNCFFQNSEMPAFCQGSSLGFGQQNFSFSNTFLPKDLISLKKLRKSPSKIAHIPKFDVPRVVKKKNSCHKRPMEIDYGIVCDVKLVGRLMTKVLVFIEVKLISFSTLQLWFPQIRIILFFFLYLKLPFRKCQFIN